MNTFLITTIVTSIIALITVRAGNKIFNAEGKNLSNRERLVYVLAIVVPIFNLLVIIYVMFYIVGHSKWIKNKEINALSKILGDKQEMELKEEE